MFQIFLRILRCFISLSCIDELNYSYINQWIQNIEIKEWMKHFILVRIVDSNTTKLNQISNLTKLHAEIKKANLLHWNENRWDVSSFRSFSNSEEIRKCQKERNKLKVIKKITSTFYYTNYFRRYKYCYVRTLKDLRWKW